MSDLYGKKQFEYDDDSLPGLLILFLILLAQEVFLGILVLALSGSYTPGFEWLGTGAGIVAVGFPVLVFACTRFARKKSLVVARLFLILRLFYLLPFAILNMIHRYDSIDPGSTGTVRAGEEQVILTGGILVILYILVFSVAWYAYLKRSRKAQEWFNADSKAKQLKTKAHAITELYD